MTPFNIQLVYTIFHPNEKWVVWKRNIKDAYFSNIIPFYDNIDVTYTDIIRLKYDASKTIKVDSEILATDKYRKFTVQEYTRLGILFKKYNIIYNKKKDTFIEK